jgi:hypothetical protein
VEKAARLQISSGSTDIPGQPVAWKKIDPLIRSIKMGTGCRSHIHGWKGYFQLGIISQQLFSLYTHSTIPNVQSARTDRQKCDSLPGLKRSSPLCITALKFENSPSFAGRSNYDQK